MDVSIIIVNYRTPQLIINCLTSIYHFTKNLSFEIIVADNDPQNGGKELVLAQFPETKWIELAMNPGFGIANNRAMDIAKGKYFLLLNADTLVKDNVVEKCYRGMNQRADVIACGALQYDADDLPMHFYRSFNEFRRTLFITPLGPRFANLLRRLFPDPVYDDPNQCDWLVGAYIFLRKEGYELTKGFDEDFFMYGEDVEWSSRLSKYGKLSYFEDCRFTHLENSNPFRRTNISWINRFSTQMQLSNMLWVRKQYGAFPFLILMFHYLSMIPIIYTWKIILNIKNSGKPFEALKTQKIYTKKVLVLTKYFWRILFSQKYLFKILPSENIDLLYAS